MTMSIQDTLESTLLSPTATTQEVNSLCAEALDNGFHLAMVNPCFISHCRKRYPDLRLGTVIDFPFGASSAEAKAAAARIAISDGADEIDFVAGTQCINDENWDGYSAILNAVRAATGTQVVKVILETAYLTSAQIQKATSLATIARINFVKTSTGYADRGAIVDDINLMTAATCETAAKRSLRPCGVKASGGIRTLEDALKMLSAGATRIGTSKALDILIESKKKK